MFDKCKEVLQHHFDINDGKKEGVVTGIFDMVEWTYAWYAIRAVDYSQMFELQNMIRDRYK